jgi:hypothetical protein
MSSNPVRILIVILLAVVGGLVIANGFDGDTTVASEAQGDESPSPSPSPEEKKDKGAGGGNGTEVQEGQVDGVRIVVYNGTDTTGLAAEVEGRLTDEGAVQAVEAADVTDQALVETTTVYYDKPEDQVNAEFIADLDFMPRAAEVAPLDDLPPVSIDPTRDVQVAVVVGTDYRA